MPDVISLIVLKRCSLSIVVAPERKKILWRPGYQGGSSTINYNFLIFERSIKKLASVCLKARNCQLLGFVDTNKILMITEKHKVLTHSHPLLITKQS